MFKKITILLLLLSLCSCTKEKNNNPIEDIPDVTIDEPIVPKYNDENPVKVGLYQNGNLVKEITAPIVDDVDIGSFDVYFTQEEHLGSSNTKNNFNKYYNNYENPEKYKIGFYISYEHTDGLKEATILSPKGMYAVSPIFNYLYDDIHQPNGAWYSHVEEGDVKDNTIYSSIKLYTAGSSDKIKSPITLTVFTYDTEDDFTEDGKYRGNSKYTITINKR